ncbi:ATP-binding protein [Winogradskyella sp.]|jgi:signal transduction histidine kinase|uniref:sensor histidine kinase n=1 Tax=Winogradskyella sp. TaxID=1883156 RepID=UPI0025DDD619|nr:ATP-binding protein [Winogradskyella sp.]MCT4629422.1 ATP-binding protein [Winogradskyella sp.]
MLLINFFKKTSVIVSALKGRMYLMFFLLLIVANSQNDKSRSVDSSIDLSNKQTNNVLVLFKEYHSVEKQKQILIQRAKSAEQSLVIQKRNYQIFSFTTIVIVLSLISFLFYNQKRFRTQQSRKESELKNALIRIETQNKLQEQRLRISRDLHNTICAQLTFIISSIDNLKYGFEIKNEKLIRKLETISSFTSGAIYELRDSIWAMNKSEITFEDLQTRISNYIDKAHLYDTKVQFVFNVEDSVDISKKFTSVEGMNIHRVTQEAIQNSLKYARASKIKVNVSKNILNYVFKISDNGIGFDIASVKSGNGFNTMRQRISSIGGELKINSKENQGTEIIVTV